MAAEDRVSVLMRLRDEVSRPARQVRQEMSAVERQMDAVNRAGDALSFDRVTRGVMGLGRESDFAMRTLGGLGSSLVSVGATAAGAAAVGLGAAAAAVTYFGVTTAAQFEQSQISFNTLLGSVEEGRATWQALLELDPVTPFNIEQLSRAEQQLLQFGFAAGESLDALRALSDLTSTAIDPADALARTARAVGQIRSNGVVLAEDLNQLVDAGIPAYTVLAESIGSTEAEVRKLMRSGQGIESAVFLEHLLSLQGTLANRRGAAQTAATETIFGQFSSFQSAIQQRLATSASPLVETLKESLPAITDAVGTLLDEVGPPLFGLVGDLARVFDDMMLVASPVLQALAEGSRDLANAAAPAMSALAPVADDLAASMLDFTDALVPVMPDLVDMLVSFVDLMPELVGVLADLAPSLATTADVLGFIADAVAWLQDKMDIFGFIINPIGAGIRRTYEQADAAGVDLPRSAIVDRLGGLSSATGSTVTDASQRTVSSSRSMQVNIYTGADPNEVVRVVRDLERDDAERVRH